MQRRVEFSFLIRLILTCDINNVIKTYHVSRFDLSFPSVKHNFIDDGIIPQ